MTDLVWKTVGRCESSGCVEVAVDGAVVHVRSSRRPDVVVMFDLDEWEAFTAETLRASGAEARRAAEARVLDAAEVCVSEIKEKFPNLGHDWIEDYTRELVAAVDARRALGHTARRDEDHSIGLDGKCATCTPAPAEGWKADHTPEVLIPGVTPAVLPVGFQFQCDHDGCLTAVAEGPTCKRHQQPADGSGAGADHAPEPLTGACAVCGGRIERYSAPSGSWWAHVVHPADGHDAVLADGSGEGQEARA